MGQPKGENFQGHIALPLEVMANQYFQKESTLKISADMISVGGFIPVMSFLLISKFGCAGEVTDFLKKFATYSGVSYNNIPYEEAKKIFDAFCQIFNEEI